MARRPIAPFNAYDGFDRVDQGWLGYASTGELWQHYVTPPTKTREETLQSISGGKGRIYFPFKGNKWDPRWYYAHIGNHKRKEAEVLGLFSSSSPTVSYVGAALQVVATGYVSASLDRNRLRLIQMKDNGTFIALTEATVPFTVSANEKFWIRFQYKQSTNTYSAKVWKYGQAEPTSWSITAKGGAVKGTVVRDGGAGIAMRAIDGVAYYGEVHKFFYYSMNGNDSEVKTYPHITSFAASRSYLDWGVNNRKNLWLSNYLASDPSVTARDYVLERQPSGSAGPYGHVISQNNSGYYWYVYSSAASTSNNVSAYAQLAIIGTASSARVGIGLRGTVNSDKSVTGYTAEIIKDTSTIRIMNGSTVLQTATLPFTVTSGSIYKMRFEVQGSTLRARAWQNNASEPGTWHVQVSNSARTSGVFYLCGLDNLAGTRYVVYDAQVSTTLASTTHTTTQPSADVITHLSDTSMKVEVTYGNDSNGNNSVTVQYRQRDTGSWKNAQINAHDRTAKKVTATLLDMEPNAQNEYRVTFVDPDDVVGTNPYTKYVTTRKYGFYYTSLSATPTSNSITSELRGTSSQPTNTTVKVRYRPYSETDWTSWINMTRTVDGSDVTFSHTYSADPDTTYLIQYEITNAWGVFGTTSVNARTVTTLGKSIELLSLGSNASATTATVTASYRYDLNDNATVNFRYRSLQDRLFTPVNAANVVVDRVNRVVRATISGLRPEMSYEVEAVPEDPDGLLAGSPTIMRTLFVTMPTDYITEYTGKQHIYRVYNLDGKFLGTWPDAPEPEYSWDMNGGVTDLTVELPRTFASIDGDPTIDHNNRVDVWVVDGDSRGLGPNLMDDTDGQLGGWVTTTSWTTQTSGGPDGGPCLKFDSTSSTLRRIVSETVYLPHIAPLVLTCVGKATGGKLRVDIAAYDKNDELIEASNDNAETVGTDWQKLTLEYLPPQTTEYVRVRVENVGKGTMHISKFSLLPKEMMIYRGFIEAYEPKIDADKENVSIQVLGVASQLSDDYIEFLQYVDVQPTTDLNQGRTNERKDPTDPANMLKEIIDLARKQNPKFQLYYTSESIRTTDTIAKYTFRNRMLRDCFDKVRSLCPPGWHYVIDPDGLVHLLGPEHVKTHRLRLNVEISAFSSNRSIRNLKNVVKFKGRQDSDGSEPDGHGSINYIAQDTASIARYGRRVTNIQDAQVTDPQTAEIIAEGRLEELNKVEEAGEAQIPDEKDMRVEGASLRGYNVQSFRPGDFVQIIDPDRGEERTRWDQFEWDNAPWDSDLHRLLKDPVPIVGVRYYGNKVVLELSQRPPQARGDFARMLAVMRRSDSDN